jgi:hypothetical protein
MRTTMCTSTVGGTAGGTALLLLLVCVFTIAHAMRSQKQSQLMYCTVLQKPLPMMSRTRRQRRCGSRSTLVGLMQLPRREPTHAPRS